MRGESGEHIASNPPYGYIDDPQDKKKWIVDKEVAKVAQRIFKTLHCRKKTNTKSLKFGA